MANNIKKVAKKRTQVAAENIEETGLAEVPMSAQEAEDMSDDGLIRGEMLAGYKDEDGNVYREFCAREITGKDEEAARRGNISQNPAKQITAILTRVLQDVGPFNKREMTANEWEELVRQIPQFDADWIFLKVRDKSMGTTFHGVHDCPNPACRQRLETTIESYEFDVKEFGGEWERPFTLSKPVVDKKGETHATGTVRLATVADREAVIPVARKNIATGKTMLLVRMMRFDDGYPVTNNIVEDMPIRDRQMLLDLMGELEYGVKFSAEITCDSCGTSFDASFNVLNFT